MVSQSPGSEASSRSRLLAAAAVEFAARGFDGAKVDRIARRARLNKAMLYYHFKNKAALYRAILADLFTALATSVAAIGPEGTPEDQLRAFIRTIAAEMAARPHFPPIWLREMAEGGRHLDASVVQHMTAVLRVLGRILENGRVQGRFGRTHPLVTQMGIVAPILFFFASAPVRERFQSIGPPELAAIHADDIVGHVEAAALAALRATANVAVTASPRRPSSRRSPA